jgi:hypothetical protein
MMRTNWNQYRRWCVGLSTGAITLGIVQGFGLVNFAYLVTQFLTTWLASLVALLLGGSLSSLIGTGVLNSPV